MIAPYYENGFFGFDFSLIIAFFIGIGFGFFLERGGLGSSKKLAAQFYLTDLTVFKVMFTAIVTTVLGLFWFSRFGILDLSQVYINPTYIIPQMVGGIVFGFGFVIGGLCPGTSCVATATGKIDGVFLLAGILFGIFLFGEWFEYFSDFFYFSYMGQITLPEYFDIPHGLMVFLITVMALAGFAGANILEKKLSGKADHHGQK